MQINDNTKAKTIQFGKLKKGEMFREPVENWFGIKLDETLETKEGDKWNAIDLETGEPARFKDNDEVVWLHNAHIEID